MAMVFKNFTSSIKTLGDFKAVFFTDEVGNDWYEIQNEFSDDTLKIMFNAEGRIVAASFDASMLAPDGLSVSEIQRDKIPASFFDKGTAWEFDGVNIVPYEFSRDELIALALEKKKSLMVAAGEAMAPLQDAVELEVATEEEKELLIDWKRYRVLLNRVDVCSAPEIEWPPVPEK